MTNEQFDVLTELMRGTPESPANQAARAVLVGGTTQADAMRELGIDRSTVSKAVTRYREADAKIRVAYLPKKSQKK
jgi:hypothetical protein